MCVCGKCSTLLSCVYVCVVCSRLVVCSVYRIGPVVEVLMLELGIINHLVPIQVRNIFIFFLFNFGVYLHKYKFQLYQFKLVHCGVVVNTRALRSSRYWGSIPARGPPNFLP